MIDTCEYLARIGYDALLTQLGDGPDNDQRILDLMRSGEAKEPAGGNGCHWLGRAIDWPNRIPNLKTWAGNMTLAKIVKSRVKALRNATDPFAFEAAINGVTGLDFVSANIDAINVGFSAARLGMPIIQRPGVELLAIIGLNDLPLISFGHRDCGFIYDGKIWRFAIEFRNGGYLARWCWMRPFVPDEIGV